ncbi:MGMT family protein [Paraferrimonas sedimenticola]|uniref:Methylated-DNA--protein-cysteine methyltransferase n=1 Tax=Paraferrimonas sedimenticola TaxID=375674 RepID=A0AA37RV24_9GAMM|nr:MGMT family protein [Paraferrimonas sedimenticola]GLP96185.1 methylated-DNA--protein-cysteine methyltransferase [Paraferrimonas sedimenticola]
MTSNERIQLVTRLIPAGCVASYGQIADLAGLPNAARQVSKALKADKDPETLPWHRVINAQGRISFPKDSAPYRLQMERLRVEGVIINNGKVDLRQFRWQPDMATLTLSIPF